MDCKHAVALASFVEYPPRETRSPERASGTRTESIRIVEARHDNEVASTWPPSGRSHGRSNVLGIGADDQSSEFVWIVELLTLWSHRTEQFGEVRDFPHGVLSVSSRNVWPV